MGSLTVRGTLVVVVCIVMLAWGIGCGIRLIVG